MTFIFLGLLLLTQARLDPTLLAVEDARAADASALIEALTSDDTDLRLQAVRALGRLERPELGSHLEPFLADSNPLLRAEAANALAQMGTSQGLVGAVEKERDPRVRAVLYESIGRSPDANEALLVSGLSEPEPTRYGAAKGLESFLRTAEATPSEASLQALRAVVTPNGAESTSVLALLALNRAGDKDVPTLRRALEHPSPEVRRLAAAALAEWRDDSSSLVRYDALRATSDCDIALDALSDPSGHVALLAIDILGDADCPPEPLEAILASSTDWRRQSHALVSLARVAPHRAAKYLPDLASHEVWQARVYAARAAQLLEDAAALEALRADAHPNVVAAALVTPEQALDALQSDDYGLMMRALALLQNDEGAHTNPAPTLLSTLERVTQQGRATSRDPRRGMLELLRQSANADQAADLAYLLDDVDPAIASLAASIITEKTGKPVDARRSQFAPPSPPNPDALDALEGARARIRMKEAGVFTIELLPKVAPMTVAQFAKLADAGYYDGLTFHRVVANFVVQGGSPGANEFVGWPSYIRDELGLLAHERGTLGISTRGRDTGDSQIFINLVANYRLDHNYTVFARVVEGMDNVDRILEGDVMESVEILRRE